MLRLHGRGIVTDNLRVRTMDRIKTLEEIRREHIRQVIRSTQGDLEEASRILGITVPALRRRLKEYGFSLEERKEKPHGS
jgi:DNA-binding NtrC family response regulator